jgi:hypothetical protein
MNKSLFSTHLHGFANLDDSLVDFLAAYRYIADLCGGVYLCLPLISMSS